jgi:hypothetical protein
VPGLCASMGVDDLPAMRGRVAPSGVVRERSRKVDPRRFDGSNLETAPSNLEPSNRRTA